jgi:hypothetical protein
VVLGLANGATFLERDQIPDLEFVLWIVRLEFLHLSHARLVLWMDGIANHSDIHGHVVGIAHHRAVHLFQGANCEAGTRERGRRRLDGGESEVGERRRLEKWIGEKHLNLFSFSSLDWIEREVLVLSRGEYGDWNWIWVYLLLPELR